MELASPPRRCAQGQAGRHPPAGSKARVLPHIASHEERTASRRIPLPLSAAAAAATVAPVSSTVACAEYPTKRDPGAHPGPAGEYTRCTRPRWTRRLRPSKAYIHPPNRPAHDDVCWPLKPCPCVDLSRQDHRSSRTISSIASTLTHNDSSSAIHALRATSSSASGLSSHPLIPRHVCYYSSRACRLVQHSTR